MPDPAQPGKYRDRSQHTSDLRLCFVLILFMTFAVTLVTQRYELVALFVFLTVVVSKQMQLASIGSCTPTQAKIVAANIDSTSFMGVLKALVQRFKGGVKEEEPQKPPNAKPARKPRKPQAPKSKGESSPITPVTGSAPKEAELGKEEVKASS